ncbi:MAG TPA: MFS transporter [Pseudomonadales bacterium]|nr:MFS transporter [Pseudomonadales bacterium]
MTSTRHIAARWYAFGYLREVVLIYPVYAIMMGANGIAPLELSVLFIVWSGSALVFEVPSGVLADRYSRKRLLAASGLVKGSVFVVWWFAPNFWGYLSGFIVWGFGSSLVSGTSESFLFDTLKQRGQTDAFARIYGRGLMANSLGVATALAGGGYAARAGYALPLVASALMPMAASLIVALTFVEPPRSAALSQPRFTGTLAAGLKEVRGNRTMLRIVAMFATLVTAYGVLDEYVGPFLIETREFSLGAIGVIYASLYAMRTLGMEAAHRLPPRSLRATAVVLAVGTLALAASTLVGGIAIAVAIGVYFALSAASEVLLQTQLQHEIEGSARATVTSLAKMAQHACEPAYLLYIGAIAQVWSFSAAFVAVAALTFALAIVFATIAPAQGR